MFTICHQLKIFYSVLVLIAVKMMDNFSRLKISSEFRFHYQSVFKYELVSLSSLLLIGLPVNSFAAAPSRTCTYVTGQVISPSCVSENEDNMFSYLQAGVDTYAAGTVNAAAIADGSVASAEIATNTITPADISGSPVDDSVFVADSASAGTWRTLTNCTDTGGNHLNYTQSTNLFSCGTSNNTNMFVGNTTRDTSLASGTQAITGVGFTPRACVFLAEISATQQASWGVATAGASNALFSNGLSVADTYSDDQTSAIYLRQAATINAYADVDSFDSDGFTLGWTRDDPGKTGIARLQYLCIR